MMIRSNDDAAEALQIPVPAMVGRFSDPDGRVAVTLRDLKQPLEQRGFHEGNTSKPGDFVIERAFAEQ